MSIWLQLCYPLKVTSSFYLHSVTHPPAHLVGILDVIQQETKDEVNYLGEEFVFVSVYV